MMRDRFKEMPKGDQPIKEETPTLPPDSDNEKHMTPTDAADRAVSTAFEKHKKELNEELKKLEK